MTTNVLGEVSYLFKIIMYQIKMIQTELWQKNLKHSMYHNNSFEKVIIILKR